MSTTGMTIDPERAMLREVEMVGRDRWEEIRRQSGAGASIRAIARELGLDCKSVRRCLRHAEPKPYHGGPSAGPVPVPGHSLADAVRDPPGRCLPHFLQQGDIYVVHLTDLLPGFGTAVDIPTHHPDHA